MFSAWWGGEVEVTKNQAGPYNKIIKSMESSKKQNKTKQTEYWNSQAIVPIFFFICNDQ